MKKAIKLISLIAAIAMIATLVAGAAYAAGSKSDIVEVVPTDPSKAVTVSDGAAQVLDAATAAKLIGGGVTADQVKVIWNKDVTGPNPNELTFKTDLAADQKGYAFHWVDGWQLIGSVNTPIAVDSYSPFAVAVVTPSGDTVAATGDNNLTVLLVCGAVAAISAVGVIAVISLKKKQA